MKHTRHNRFTKMAGALKMRMYQIT